MACRFHASKARRALAGRTFASLHSHRNFRLFFSGQAVSLTGTWMQDAALPWLVLQLTHSPLHVGLLVFCRYAPFLLSLHAGVLADRFDNRRFMIASQAASLAIAVTLGTLTFVHWTPLWAIYLLATLGGAAVVLDAPHRFALIYQLVGREKLANATALNSSAFSSAQAIGPAVGGIIIATLGVAWCFAFNALSFLSILAALFLIRPSEMFPLDRGEARPGMLEAIREGLTHVRRSSMLKTVLGLALFLSLTGFSFRVLIPVLADQTLHAGPTGFGLLFSCFGVGALIGALVTASLGTASWNALIVGALMFNGTVLLIAPLQNAVASALLLVGTGIGFAVWTANGQSILQLNASDGVRGRVMSLWLLAFGGVPVGGVLAGFLSDAGGTRLAYAVAGAGGLAATGIAFARVGSTRAPYTRATVGLTEEL